MSTSAFKYLFAAHKYAGDSSFANMVFLQGGTRSTAGEALDAIMAGEGRSYNSAQKDAFIAAVNNTGIVDVYLQEGKQRLERKALPPQVISYTWSERF